MTLPADKIGNKKFGLKLIENYTASSKQNIKTDTNMANWNPHPALKFDVQSNPIKLLMIQSPMYVILVMAGFGTYVGFNLSEPVLITLIGSVVAVALPTSINLAVTALRNPTRVIGK